MQLHPVSLASARRRSREFPADQLKGCQLDSILPLSKAEVGEQVVPILQ